MSTNRAPSREPAQRIDPFDRFASRVAKGAGHPAAFISATSLVVLWAVLGASFHFSNGWQLVINTSTTILTFLMVFIIQNTINRDSAALHLKLDELIRVTAKAHDALMGSQNLGRKQIEELDREEHRAAGKRTA